MQQNRIPRNVCRDRRIQDVREARIGSGIPKALRVFTGVCHVAWTGGVTHGRTRKTSQGASYFVWMPVPPRQAALTDYRARKTVCVKEFSVTSDAEGVCQWMSRCHVNDYCQAKNFILTAFSPNYLTRTHFWTSLLFVLLMYCGQTHEFYGFLK